MVETEDEVTLEFVLPFWIEADDVRVDITKDNIEIQVRGACMPWVPRACMPGVCCTNAAYKPETLSDHGNPAPIPAGAQPSTREANLLEAPPRECEAGLPRGRGPRGEHVEPHGGRARG